MEGLFAIHSLKGGLKLRPFTVLDKQFLTDLCDTRDFLFYESIILR